MVDALIGLTGLTVILFVLTGIIGYILYGNKQT
jgi:hypothetical protein